jgi:hypothetical protein
VIRPLFIIGNKRSGTSQLVRVLNLHPQLFVSHESDIAWILYQFHQDQPFRPHAWDSDRGMQVTLKLAGHLLNRQATPSENFLAAQAALMEQGTPWLPPRKNQGLEWIGDKKPMQHTDPKILQFLLQHFPEAHFLHIVRHPFEVAASSDRFNQTADGDFWLGLSTAEKVERWAYHEQQVLQLHRDLPGRCHSLRYEDFCRQTPETLAAVFAFLAVTPDSQVLQAASRQTHPPHRAVPSVPCSAEARRIAELYGYDLRPAGRLRNLTQSLYWRAVKQMNG